MPSSPPANIFVSCEDEMPRLHGVHNFACTVTAVLILLVPLRICQQVLMCSDKQPVVVAEKLAYAASLVLLFWGNLVEHAVAYVGPPSLDACGAIFHLALFAMTYRGLWLQSKRRHNKEFAPRLALRLLPSSQFMSRVSLILAILLLGTGALVSARAESLLVQCLSPVYAAVNIALLGYLSWHQKRQSCSNEPTPWFWFCSSFLCFGVVQISVEWEKGACHILAQQDVWRIIDGRRLYHAAYLHTVIPTLFWAASKCAFGVLKEEKNGGKQKKKKIP